jgi:hypothetical protein
MLREIGNSYDARADHTAICVLLNKNRDRIVTASTLI